MVRYSGILTKVFCESGDCFYCILVPVRSMTTTSRIQITFLLLVAPIFAGNTGDYTYLALGDSVPFGLSALLLPPYSSRVPTPGQFVGYPETVAQIEHLANSKKEVNASCPGETSGSFLNAALPDYGCNSSHLQPPAPPIPPFKTTFGLHTPYTGAQMDFAVAQLTANKHINLVTLSIGANDILLALPQLQQCGNDPVCAQNVLGPVLQTYAGNLAQILVRIRAHYQGTLVLMKYYSPAPALDSVTIAVNQVMTQVAAQLAQQPNFASVQIADAFTAFQLASAAFNQDACQAGLLIRLPPSPSTPPCDIHPSPLGRDLLAATVILAQSQSESDSQSEKP
jgi:lysophospholipase L1-like esterase